MAYHGLMMPLAVYVFRRNKETGAPVTILEIGIDKGIGMFALLNNLNTFRASYRYYGVDIELLTGVREAVKYMIFHPDCWAGLREEDSLVYLKNDDKIYDVVLVDGDHSYETVSQECKMLPNRIHKDTLILFDDYYGGKHGGVKIAVDEFLQHNKHFKALNVRAGATRLPAELQSMTAPFEAPLAVGSPEVLDALSASVAVIEKNIVSNSGLP